MPLNPTKWDYVGLTKEHLGISSDDLFHSIVVFSGSAELKKMDSANVVQLYKLLSHIYTKHILRQNKEQVISYEQQLKDNKPAAHKDMKQHVSAIHKKVANAGKVCPKCGSVLVQRNGKHGVLWDVQVIQSAGISTRGNERCSTCV